MSREHVWAQKTFIDAVCRKCGQDWNTEKPTANCPCYRIRMKDLKAPKASQEPQP